MRHPCLTQKAPYKGRGADSEEKHEPVSDIGTAAADSLKVLDPNRPIREADIEAPVRFEPPGGETAGSKPMDSGYRPTAN